MFNNEVRGPYGKVIGFRCDTCGNVVEKMWGNTCNACRENERRHEELLAALRGAGQRGGAK